MTREHIKANLYLPLLLMFILADVVCDNSIFRAFNKAAPFEQLILFGGVLLLQIVAAPIQSGLSDFYGRKASLIVALAFSLAALILQYLLSVELLQSFLFVLMLALFKGAFGNTIPLAWVAIADTQEKNVRFSFALSTAAFAVAYLLLGLSNKYIPAVQSNVATILIYALLVVLCVIAFKDLEDCPNRRHAKVQTHPFFHKNGLLFRDIGMIVQDLKQRHRRNALLAFLLWEISLYSILLLYIDFELSEFSSVALAMGFGYLFGVLILKFCNNVSDHKIIKWGYNISSISLIPFFVTYPFIDNDSFDFTMLAVCYFLHMMGNAFLSATLFSMLANEGEPYEQGKIYGLIASVDTLAFLLSSIIAIAYNFYEIHLIYIIGISFLTVAISWAPYAKFEKTRPKRA